MLGSWKTLAEEALVDLVFDMHSVVCMLYVI